MSLKKILSFISLSVLFLVIILIAFNFKGGFGADHVENDEIIGKGMSHRIYDEKNKLLSEISSSSTERDYVAIGNFPQDRVLLTDIKAVIYKHGQFKSDVKFSGNSGYVENSYNDFLIKGNARIESKEALFLSERFFMKGSAMISNDERTKFLLKNLRGKAENGLEYILNYGVLNLFKATGIFVRSGKKYNFNCNKLMILKKLNRIVFRGNSLITNKESSMKGKEIIYGFNDGFVHVKRVDILGKGNLVFKKKSGKIYRKISGKVITGFFSDDGNIKKIEVSKNGIVDLLSDGNRIKAASRLIYIGVNPQTNKLSSIKIMQHGKIESKGKRSFDIISEKIVINYDSKGEIEKCYAQGDTEFNTDGYNGSTNIFKYFPGKDLITLKGEDSLLEKGGNRFVSSEFTVNTKEQKLYSDKKIRSTLILKSGNSIFSKDPVYVSSKKVEIDDKSGTVIYSEGVSLFQGDTKLDAVRVEIGNNKSISISGKAKLTFINGEQKILLGGDELNIDSDKNLLNIKGKSVLSDGDNLLSGDSLIVMFDKSNMISRINGEGKVVFKRKSISGKSDKVIWKFNRKIITFFKNAELIKAQSGSSKGNEIQFFIENERIIIKSADGKRSETKID